MKKCSRQRKQLLENLEVREPRQTLKINIIQYGRSRVIAGMRREISWSYIMDLDSISKTMGSNIIRFAC